MQRQEQLHDEADASTSGNSFDQLTEKEKADLSSLNSVFSLRKPKDIRAGLASGTKSIIKGVLAGGVTLFAAPAFGFWL